MPSTLVHVNQNKGYHAAVSSRHGLQPGQKFSVPMPATLPRLPAAFGPSLTPLPSEFQYYCNKTTYLTDLTHMTCKQVFYFFWPS